MSDTTTTTTLPSLSAQAERLIELGVHDLGRMPADELRSFALSQPGRAIARL